MFGSRIRVEVIRNPAIRGWDVYFLREKANGDVEVMGSDELMPASSGGEYPGPTFSFSEELAESLVQGLSGAGVRTESDSRIEGELEATKKHLEDLRELLGLARAVRSRKVEVDR